MGALCCLCLLVPIQTLIHPIVIFDNVSQFCWRHSTRRRPLSPWSPQLAGRSECFHEQLLAGASRNPRIQYLEIQYQICGQQNWNWTRIWGRFYTKEFNKVFRKEWNVGRVSDVCNRQWTCTCFWHRPPKPSAVSTNTFPSFVIANLHCNTGWWTHSIPQLPSVSHKMGD